MQSISSWTDIQKIKYKIVSYLPSSSTLANQLVQFECSLTNRKGSRLDERRTTISTKQKWSQKLNCHWVVINWIGDLAIKEIAPLCSFWPMCEQWPLSITSVSATTRRTLNTSKLPLLPITWVIDTHNRTN